MSVIYKLTNMFQLTTVATNPTYAVAHTGGWSESHWSLTDPYVTPPGVWHALRLARAKMLPATASIIGVRVQKYDMVGNQLKPQGSRIETVATPGVLTNVTDLPQVALQLVAGNVATPNKAVVMLRGIPDSQMTGGEYAPVGPFDTYLNAWRSQLVASTFGFVGRDRSQASTKVLSASVADGILVDGIPATGLVPGDWVRFNRVFADGSVPIIGPMKVTSVVGNVIRVQGWLWTITKPTGTLRRDLMVFVPYGNTFLRRATVKKIGSPFEKYRGRRSRKRV